MAIYTTDQREAIVISNQDAIADIQANTVQVPNLTDSQKLEFNVKLSDYIPIQNALVLKTTPATGNNTTIEIDDKFIMWLGDRVVAGKILTAGVTLLTDYLDDTKVALAVNNEI